MLKRIDDPIENISPRGPGPANSVALDLDPFLSAGRRQAIIIATFALAGLLVGCAYDVLSTPQYTATTDLLIDSQKKTDKNEDVSASIAELTFDTAAIDSQVEVLKSEKIALAVVSNLNLTEDPEFVGADNSWVGRTLAELKTLLDFRQWFAVEPKSDADPKFLAERAAIGKLENNMQVRRVGHTYVLAVDYTSSKPKKAAVVANAFAEAYLNDQLDAKYDAARRASSWMEERIAQLKAQSLSSDLAVQKFKAEHGLVSTDGKLVSEQQLTELNSQLVTAHSETARAEARFNQISEMLKSGEAEGAVTDSLGSPIINDLRQKFLAASKTESELEAKLGPEHLQVVNLRRNMAEYKRQIFDELKRIAETYRSEGEVARAKELSLRNSLASLEDQSASTNQTLVQLRELERESDTYRMLYQNFLQRYQETVQQQSSPITEARVITSATPPGAASRPKRSLALAMSLVIGSLIGLAIAALREYRDRVFRTAAQVRDELGLEFLGILPALREERRMEDRAGEGEHPRHVKISDAIQRYSIDHPLSSFAETLRSMKVTLELSLSDRRPKIVGVVSVLPGEGKSTLAKNFASLLSHLGAQTLLIDGDLRNPGLTRAVAPNATEGTIEVLRGGRPLSEVLVTESESNLYLLPTVLKRQLYHTSDLLASPNMRALLNGCSESFEYIIVDLPPVGPVVDVRAAGPMFDAFIMVVEWGRTARAVVRTALLSDATLYHKCIGVAFNKVDLKKIHLYESKQSKDYYHARYKKYYTLEKEVA